MKIEIAKHAGFCMGVRRAVEMVFDAAAKKPFTPIYTFGPLVHNPQVLNLLGQRGIGVLDQVPNNGCGTVLIRAHGVRPNVETDLKIAGFDVLDATCPRVVKIQRIIRAYTRKGYKAVIIGDEHHPEVMGLLGYAEGGGCVVGNVDELVRLPEFEKAVVVAQSTQNTAFFKQVRDWMAQNRPHYKIFNTICDSTEQRQAELKRLAGDVDTVIVVGGKNSGNTRRLVEIVRECGKPVCHIEAESDLDAPDISILQASRNVGITAGASTPNWVIKKVYRALEELPYKPKPNLGRLLFKIQRMLLLTNLYVSLGAGCLAYACTKLAGMQDNLLFFFLSMFYVQSMHIINHLTGQTAQQYNDPDRAAFYMDHRYALTGMAILAMLAGMAVALAIGVWTFYVFSLMSLVGLSYNFKIIPGKFKQSKYQRIRDIPASKVILVAVAWAVLAVVVPPLSTQRHLGWMHLVLFLWVVGLVFARTAFFDILDMQGDRIVGKETIALLLGEKKLLRLLETLLVGLIMLLAAAAAFHLVLPVGFGIMLGPIFFLVLMQAYKNGNVLPGVRLEFLADTHFILAGLIAFFWPH